MAQGKLDVHLQNIEIRSLFYTTHVLAVILHFQEISTTTHSIVIRIHQLKTSMKVKKNLNVRCKAIECFEENIRKNLLDVSLSNSNLERTPKA
jgi:hypothetical protein